MTTGTVSETGSPQRNRRPNRVLSFLRNTWRGLTSMRTALILLFLLALATMPGALLPQHSLNEGKTQTYISEHGWWGRLLDATGFLNVYSSVWFAAIYLLLMISLVGCLLPRSVEHARQLREQPVLVPRNFDRLPHKASATVTASPDEVLASARPLLRGWRIAERSEDSGVRTISAEKGFLREVGNLMFHFALLGLIISVALGSMFSYKGQVAVIADGSQFCNSGPLAYDAFTPGPRVDGTNLAPFCVKVNDFTARYLANRQPTQYESNVEYQSGKDLQTGQWRPYHLEVNDPLRVAGDRVYLLDHGYAPTVTVTYPNGEKRTQTQVFRPTEVSTYFSEGAVKFTETPGITDPVEQRKKQLAVTGLFAPTAAMQGKLLAGSTNPELRDPVFAADVYQGDLGVDSGKGQSIYEIDHQMIAQDRLHRVDRVNLKPGQQTKLADGTAVRFDGVKKFASLEIAHDPTQVWVLVFAIALLLGLFGSLVIKRRRVWLRAKPAADGSTLITVGALARTDQAGYGEEFTKLSRALLTATRGKDD